MCNGALFGFVAATALTLTPTTAVATQPGEPALQRPGKQLYRRLCIQCHGARPTRLARLDQKTFSTAVTRGVNLMPPFGGRLNVAEIDAIWRFIRSQQDSR